MSTRSTPQPDYSDPLANPEFRNLLISALRRTTPQFTPAEQWAQYSDQITRQLEPPPNTFSGRSIKVANGDYMGAYRKLMNIVNENKVRRTLRLTERHEKKGVKRRRLEQETHKRKFAQMVRQKVRLAMTIRQKGG